MMNEILDTALIVQRLDELRQLKDGDGQAVLPNVLASYSQQVPDAFEDMQQALAEGDFDRLKRSAHSLGGSSALLGGQGIYSLCRTLQLQAVEAADRKACGKTLDEVRVACDQLLEMLEQATAPGD